MSKDNKVHFKENLKLFYKTIKGERRVVWLLLFLALVFEALMIADNILIKLLVDYGNAYLAGTYISEEIIEIFSIVLGVFLGLVLIRATLRFFQIHMRNRLLAKVDYNVKKKYFNRVLSFDYEFHTKNKSGALISKLDRGASASVSLTELVTQRLFGPLFSLIVVLFSIAYFDLAPALVAFGTGVLIVLFSWKIFANQAKSKIEQNDSLDEEKGFVSTILSSFEAVKFFGKEPNIKKRYTSFIDITKHAFIKFNDHYKLYVMLLSLTFGVGTALLLYVSLRSFVAGDITIGTVVFIFTTFGRMIMPIIGLADSLRTFNESMSDVQALFTYDKIENEVKDSDDAKPLKIEKGAIEFRDVSFGYGKGGSKIFNKLNIAIKPHESVAIVGSSGSGKTSLMRLLFRLYDADKGEILIDGKNVKSVKQQSLRNQMSIVPQEPILFHDTIYNNVKFSNSSAKRADVMRALRQSSASAFVNKFEKKENTLVGERGVRLSGGEKQRIAIARALLADKRILVLDEPTSSLDLETEYKIQQGIKNLLKNRTSIIVAHRLSTIKDVDRIIVLKRGRVFEEGTHRELLRKKGEYAKLWEYQKLHGDEVERG